MPEFAGFDPTEVRDLEWFRLAFNDGAVEEIVQGNARGFYQNEYRRCAGCEPQRIFGDEGSEH